MEWWRSKVAYFALARIHCMIPFWYQMWAEGKGVVIGHKMTNIWNDELPQNIKDFFFSFFFREENCTQMWAEFQVEVKKTQFSLTHTYTHSVSYYFRLFFTFEQKQKPKLNSHFSSFGTHQILCKQKIIFKSFFFKFKRIYKMTCVKCIWLNKMLFFMCSN